MQRSMECGALAPPCLPASLLTGSGESPLSRQQGAEVQSESKLSHSKTTPARHEDSVRAAELGNQWPPTVTSGHRQTSPRLYLNPSPFRDALGEVVATLLPARSRSTN